MLGDDIDECGLDILGHALGVPADIEMRAFGKPAPELGADFAHAVLHVIFLGAVPRPGQRQPAQNAGLAQRVQFVAVEEIVVLPLMAEE